MLLFPVQPDGESGTQVDFRVEEVFAGVEDSSVLEPACLAPLGGATPVAVDLHQSSASGRGVGLVV